MKIDNEFSFTDIEKEINYSIANEINTHFIVTGELAYYIVDYLETEHEIPQFSECEDESDKLYGFCLDEVYTISINANNDFIYFVQETYYDKLYGKILADVGGEEDIVYVESATNLSLLDLKRVHGKQVIIFDLEEDELDDCCDSEEEYYALNLLLDRVENLESEVEKLKNGQHMSLSCYNSMKVDSDTLDEAMKYVRETIPKLIRNTKFYS